MCVVQLVETLATGGAEKLAVQIASMRARAGDDSYLVTLSGQGPLAVGLDPSVKVFDLGLDPGSVLVQARTLARFLALCRRLRPDALQTHLPRANFFGLFAAMSMKMAIFPTIHNNREFDYGSSRGKLRLALRKRAYQELLRRGRRMIAVSDSVKQAMIGELGLDTSAGDRIAVVPNGVEIPAPLDPQDRAEVRRRFGINSDSVLVAGVGRLTEQKNFPDLVLALSDLGGDVPPWECIIAGDGPESGALAGVIREAGLTGRVHLPGRVSDVGRLMNAADIFCMPSLWEGLPLALLEAMAVGLPIAAYAIDGIKEVVRDGGTGRLVKVGDTVELAAALRELMLTPQLRSEWGREARRVARRDFALDRMIERLGEIYTERPV